MGPSQFIPNEFRQKEITEDEYQLRKSFAEFFCYYHDAIKSCIALGIEKAYAEEWARFLMADCITRQLIQERHEYLATENGLKEVKNVVITKLMELGDFAGEGSSHGARVTAWTNIARILGLDKPETTELIHKGGVMLVPHMVDADSWGEFASKSQSNLKETVKE